MRNLKARSLVGLLALVAVVAVLGAAVAEGAVHVTSATLHSPTMAGLSVESTGDAGEWAGNEFPSTSLVDTGVAEWFNQPVTFRSPAIHDSLDSDDHMVTTGAWWTTTTDGISWSAPSFFESQTPVVVSRDGVYRITATGTDDGSGDATGAIKIGIDTVRPVVHVPFPKVPSWDVDAWPVFTTPAIITITATDSLSGVERIQYSVSGAAHDYTYDAVPGTTALSVPVSVTATGARSLTWHVFDNAGNIRSDYVNFIVRPVGFVPSVRLKSLGSKNGLTTISGEISPLPNDSQVTIVVQRKQGRSWHYLASKSATLAKYADDYRVTITLPPDLSCRAIVLDSGGASGYRSFKTH